MNPETEPVGPPTGSAAGVLLATTDRLVRERVLALADQLGLGGEYAGRGAPALVVVDLAGDDAVRFVADWRARWPDAVLAGYLAEPRPEVWVEGQRAGCDLVVNRGALVVRLRELFSAPGGVVVRRRRYPLFAADDAAGRLGLVFHADTTPVGPLAVYQVDGRLHAVGDRCPHAGATLSEGPLDGAVVTCPRHGSRFDVRTGERVRGPADADLQVFRVVEDSGQVVLLVDSGSELHAESDFDAR